MVTQACINAVGLACERSGMLTGPAKSGAMVVC
jgi:hypothetical protein